MTNGQKMRKLFEEKKLVVAPGCHDALTAKSGKPRSKRVF